MSNPGDWATVYIGLGSNLDNPLQQVSLAVEEIAATAGCTLSKQSSWYQSKAVGPGEQPDYINGVIELHTQLEPLALLRALQSIEQAHQRKRELKWGARTLDLDILVYGDQACDDAILTIPHPQLTNRDFVLVPLAEIAPNLALPNHKSLKELGQNCPKSTLKSLKSN